jgi:hypothetical protein
MNTISNNWSPNVAMEANCSSLVHHKRNIDNEKKTKDYNKTMSCNCLYLNKNPWHMHQWNK